MEIYLEQLANKTLYVALILTILAIGFFFNLSEWVYFLRLRRQLRTLRNGTDAAQTMDASVVGRVLGRYRAMQSRSGARMNVGAFVSADTLELRIPLLLVPFRFTVPGLERGVRTCSSITIAVGLIGTFMGLTLSLFNLKDSLAALEATQEITTRSVLEGIVAKLREPLEGMSLAFLTSVLGVATSAALTGIVTLISGPSQREAYEAELEAYLQNEIPADASSTDATDLLRALLASFQGLEQSLRAGLTAPARAIESLAEVLGPAAAAFETNGSRMTDAASRMERASTGLEATAGRLVTGLDQMEKTLVAVSNSLGGLEGGMNAMGEDNHAIARTLGEIRSHLAASSQALEAEVKKLGQAGAGIAGAANTLATEKQQLGQELAALRQQNAGVAQVLRDFLNAIDRFGSASGKLQGELSQFMTGYEGRVETVLGRQFADLHLALETLRRVLEQSGAESVDRLELILETIRDSLLRAEELTAASRQSGGGGGAV